MTEAAHRRGLVHSAVAATATEPLLSQRCCTVCYRRSDNRIAGGDAASCAGAERRLLCYSAAAARRRQLPLAKVWRRHGGPRTGPCPPSPDDACLALRGELKEETISRTLTQSVAASVLGVGTAPGGAGPRAPASAAESSVLRRLRRQGLSSRPGSALQGCHDDARAPDSSVPPSRPLPLPAQKTRMSAEAVPAG